MSSSGRTGSMASVMASQRSSGPLEVGCALVRSREEHLAAFATQASYLAPAPGGIASRADRFADDTPTR